MGNVADASTTHTNVHSDPNSAISAAKIAEEVSKTPKKPKMPNSPIGPKIWQRGEAEGLGYYANGSTVRKDMQSVETDARMATKLLENVRGGYGRKTHLIGSK